MTMIVLGVALWSAAHLFKRLAPDARLRLGDAGKGVVTLLLLVALALMVIGYRGAEQVDLWYPPAFLVHLNNLLMLFAFYLFAASGLQTALARKIRHPQLTAVKTWAVAHLLVNGDLASVLLFGGLLVWAVAEVIVINRAQRNWTPPARQPARKEIIAFGAAVGLMGVVMMIHNWLGVQPWS